MGRSLRISENTPVEISRTDEMNTIWLGDEMPPKVASTTLVATVPDGVMATYRATIVPDEKMECSATTEYDTNGVMTPKEAIGWLKMYAIVNDNPDLKEAVVILDKALRNIL